MMKGKNYYLIFILFFSFCTYFCTKKGTEDKRNLNGAWELLYNDNWIKANVPGNVHCDLFANNIIPDPYYASNSDSLNWIAEKTWKYRKNVVINNYSPERNYELVFEGIDTYATVFFNSVEIGTTNNMFLKYSFPIPDSLINKNNLLEVVIHPSILYNKEKADSSKYVIDNKRIFTRKAQFQSGWDWSPSFETCGIYKDVYINSWIKLKIENLAFICDSICDSVAFMSSHFEVVSQNYYNASLKIISNNNEFDTITKNVEILEGRHKYKKEFQIKNPKLWWCNGLGEAKLYDSKFQINTKFRVLEENCKFGIRDIKLVREKDSVGESFAFVLNGIPVFAKGANWIPAEYFSGKNSKENYLDLLSLAKEANFNLLRVWGGGIYENDDFYDICDSLGIMVWQDFMFACAMYPADSSFMTNVEKEAEHQINRLKSHPSLVLWCGNNEVHNGWHDWGWQKYYNINKEDSTKIWEDYKSIFEKLLPNLVSKNGANIQYISTSPQYGWGHKECITHGDSHYWGIWWGMEDFSVFYDKTGRFMSEYGMQSFPSYNSLKKFIPENYLTLWSKPLKTHQKHGKGFETIDEYLRRDYYIENDLQYYSYISQIMQAEGMQIAFDAHLSDMPRCMGTLFWQYNDCWPSISWSAVDYYKSPKALYYFAKENFKQIRTLKTQDNNTVLINHNNFNINVKAVYKTYSFDGHLLTADTVVIIANKLSVSKLPFAINNSSEKYSEISIYDNKSKKILDNRFFIPKQHENYSLLNPKIEITQEKFNDYYIINLKSDKFIEKLFLNADNCDGYFSDNFFDLPNRRTIKIYFYPKKNNEASDNLEISYYHKNLIFDNIK